MYYQEKLSVSNEVFKSTGHGTIVTDTNGVIIAVNIAFTNITSFTESEAVGQTPQILKTNGQDKTYYENMWKCIKERGIWEGELWNRKENGEEYLEKLIIIVVKDEAGEEAYYVGTFIDATSQSKSV